MIMRGNATSQVATDFNKVVGPKSDSDPFIGTNVMPGKGSAQATTSLERGHFSS